MSYSSRSDCSSRLLPPEAIALLGHRSIGKRREGADIVGNLIREYLSANIMEGDKFFKDDKGEIWLLLDSISSHLIRHSSPFARSGGLLCLACTALSLQENIKSYQDRIITMILPSFSDQDSNVRYYACEALYNIASITKHSIMNSFEAVFDSLCKQCSDIDPNVRSGALYLDHLLKDLVCECQDPPSLEISKILASKMHITNTYIRQMIITWVTALTNVPAMNILSHLDILLEGLLNMLSDSNRDIRNAADDCLTGLLREIKQGGGYVLEQALKPLISGLKNKQQTIRLTSIVWVHALTTLHSDISRVSLFPQLLSAILLCVSEEPDIRRIAEAANTVVLDNTKAGEYDSDLSSLMEVLLPWIGKSDQPPSVLAGLEWLGFLLSTLTNEQQLGKMSERIVEGILGCFRLEHEQVTIIALGLLGQVSKFGSTIVRLVGRRIMELFKLNRNLLKKSGKQILQKLCSLIDPLQLYEIWAESIATEDDLSYLHQFIHTINWNLLTSKETIGLRKHLLKDCDYSVKIFKSWFNNLAAALALALWTERYELAAEIVEQIGGLVTSTELISQLDRLVHLLESPIFVKTRLHLLQPDKYPSLHIALLGLSMILSQNQTNKLLLQRISTAQMLPQITPARSENLVGLKEELEAVIARHIKFLSLPS